MLRQGGPNRRVARVTGKFVICAASHSLSCSTYRPPNSQIPSPVSSSSDTLQAASTQKERFGYLALEVALARALLCGRQIALVEELSQEQNWLWASMPLAALLVTPCLTVRSTVRSRLPAAPCYRSSSAQGVMVGFECATAGCDRHDGKGSDPHPCGMTVLAEARAAEMERLMWHRSLF